MNAFLRAIRNFYLGLFNGIGNVVMITFGCALAAYATYAQFQPLHNTPLNATLLGCGVLFIVSDTVRRFVWMLVLLTLIWGGMIYSLVSARDLPHHDPELTPGLLAFMTVPPLLASLVFAMRRPREEDSLETKDSQPSS